ncbi:MAG TPA: hypothetical protein VFK90_07705, partial [Anaeromyxobacter sp.]|nr:hypothetical protein [Anaeromyxobacter sp.]
AKGPAAAQAPAPSAPSAAARGPAPAPPVELELEEPVDPATAPAAPFDAVPASGEPTPDDGAQGEPILATELAPQDGGAGDAAGARFTAEEAAVLGALERLAAGHHAEPDILKPAQAMAALVRLLVRKGIVSEREFLDELKK